MKPVFVSREVRDTREKFIVCIIYIIIDCLGRWNSIRGRKKSYGIKEEIGN